MEHGETGMQEKSNQLPGYRRKVVISIIDGLWCCCYNVFFSSDM